MNWWWFGQYVSNELGAVLNFFIAVLEIGKETEML